MTVYVVVVRDRHTDDDVDVFADKDAAVLKATKVADSYGDGWRERTAENLAGVDLPADWTFVADTTEEGDQVMVYEREVQ